MPINRGQLNKLWFVLTMEYAAVERTWKICLSGYGEIAKIQCSVRKSKVRTVVLQHANFCVNREESNMYTQRNFEKMAEKLVAGERAMQ